jgi:hypothetical protein
MKFVTVKVTEVISDACYIIEVVNVPNHLNVIVTLVWHEYFEYHRKASSSNKRSHFQYMKNSVFAKYIEGNCGVFIILIPLFSLST